MDVMIEHDLHKNKTQIIYKTIGGAIDFRFVLGEKNP